MLAKSYLYLLYFLGIAFVLPASATAPEEKKPISDPDNLIVRGVLVCINKDLEETNCAGKHDTFGLRANNGQIYPLKAGKSVETLNTEKRLQTKAFQLTLRRENPSPFYEIVKSQLVRGGKVYDFFYFCEVCNITTYAPGPCMCCQAETEYREKLAE